MGFLGGTSGKEPACQCRGQKRRGFDPRVRRITWKRAWQPTPIFLPGEFHVERSLVGFSLWGHRESDTTERLSHMDTCVASLVAQIVKNLPAMQEIWDQSPGLGRPLEKGMATHSNILAWRIPWTEEPGRPQSVVLQSWTHWETNTHTYTHTYTWILEKEEGPLGMFPLGENKYKERVGREGNLLGNPHG